MGRMGRYPFAYSHLTSPDNGRESRAFRVASSLPFGPPRARGDSVCQTHGRGMTPLATPARPASACWSPFVSARMRWRRGDRVLLLAIPIKLMLSPVPVPTCLEGLDVGGGHIGKTAQRQESGTDRHPGRRGTMMGLAMRTPHHRRQDLPRAAYALEGGIQSVTEQEHGVHGHRRICGLPEHRDHRWEPDLLGIAGRHPHPLPCLGILWAFPRCVRWAYGMRQSAARGRRSLLYSVLQDVARGKYTPMSHVLTSTPSLRTGRMIPHGEPATTSGERDNRLCPSIPQPPRSLTPSPQVPPPADRWPRPWSCPAFYATPACVSRPSASRWLAADATALRRPPARPPAAAAQSLPPIPAHRPAATSPPRRPAPRPAADASLARPPRHPAAAAACHAAPPGTAPRPLQELLAAVAGLLADGTAPRTERA